MTDKTENQPTIALEQVSLHRDRPLLTDVSWTVRRGEHWVVLGRNGAGKTLLLRIAAGYLWPSRGEARILGRRFGQVDLRVLRREIGWVSSALTERIPPRETAMDVVLSGAFATFGLYEAPTADLRDRAAGLMDDLGLGRLAGARFGKLSAGERQRVLLARSRLGRPRLLILDEPCAGLDLAARERFLALVEKIAADPEGPSLVMVTHRVDDIVSGFTHGLFLGRGRVVASGPLEDVLTDASLSRAMEIPVKVLREGRRWRASVVLAQEGTN